jgi:acyl carrier protein
MADQILQRVMTLAAVVTKWNVADLAPDTKLYADLSLDSAQALELVVELEDAFDIQIANKDASELQTLADIAALVRRLTGKRTR